EVALQDLAVAGVARHAENRFARGGRLAVEVVAERLETGVVGEVRDDQLAELLRLILARDLGKDLAGGVDGDLDGVLRNGDNGLDEVALNRDELPVGILVEGAGSRVEQ